METIDLSINNAEQFISISQYTTKAIEAYNTLISGKGKGNDFLGWVNLPSQISASHIDDINLTARSLREKCDIVVVIGIGGSYLGAKAVIDALSSSFAMIEDGNSPKMVYAGQNIGEDYILELTQLLRNKRFGIICISKSGTTTEPAIAFRILQNQLEEQVGKAAAQSLIVCITDRNKGALRTLADRENYKTFVIEDNVGGRFSVLSPVGLLPIAVAGFDIAQLIGGAKTMKERCVSSNNNIAVQYAMMRNALYACGKKIEILANFNPKLKYLAEWWKQLYGESEGKSHKGIFPVSVNFSTDLHSMGQMIQDGERTIFETVLSVGATNQSVLIPFCNDNLDGLNFIAGKHIDHINKMAEKGTVLAHIDGGVPIINISLPRINEYHLGELIYFFMFACGVSAYMIDVNPFDQPGVEEYKRNMFALLEKPGYEEQTKQISKRIQ